MYRLALIILAGFAVIALAAPKAQAGVDVGVSLDEDGIKGFYLAIGDHYEVKEKEVVFVREQKIPDDELPVVFFISRHAGVAPATIVKLRLGGKSWMDIAFHYGLTAEIFYVQFAHDPGPPYGKAWGHFKRKKRSDWGSIRFSDVDIVNFVNLKFVSERYGHTPAEIAKMRAKGDDFVAIHKKVKANKGQKKRTQVVAAKPASKGKKKKH